jgi:hypothetical protein
MEKRVLGNLVGDRPTGERDVRQRGASHLLLYKGFTFSPWSLKSDLSDLIGSPKVKREKKIGSVWKMLYDLKGGEKAACRISDICGLALFCHI